MSENRALEGRTGQKLLLTILGIPALALITFGLIILGVQLGALKGRFASNQALSGLMQISIYPSLIAIWFKPAVPHPVRIKILTAAVALGFSWWLFVGPGGIIPSGVAIVFVGTFLADPSCLSWGNPAVDSKNVEPQGAPGQERAWSQGVVFLIVAIASALVALGAGATGVQGGGPFGVLVWGGVACFAFNRWRKIRSE